MPFFLIMLHEYHTDYHWSLDCLQNNLFLLLLLLLLFVCFMHLVKSFKLLHSFHSLSHPHPVIKPGNITCYLHIIPSISEHITRPNWGFRNVSIVLLWFFCLFVFKKRTNWFNNVYDIHLVLL